MIKLKKKERKKEKNGTEQSRTTGLIGKRSEHIQAQTYTYIYTRISHAEKTGCAYLYVHISLHIFYVLRLSTMLNQAKK